KGKILVTGGAGYIGSHTVVELIDNNYEVVVVDNLTNSYEFVIDRINTLTNSTVKFENVDVCNEIELKRVFIENSDILGIIHFAALKAVGESVIQPLKYYNNNVVGLLNLLNVCDLNKVNNLVFSSSCTVYGQPDVLPVTELSPRIRPESPYGNTKKIAEEIIEDFSATSDFKAILLRYFNPIGAHPTSLLGELPIGIPNNLVPVVTQTAAGLREKVTIYGNDYPTADGTCIRDYIDVIDLAKAHVIAIDRLLNKKRIAKVEAFNLGTGRGFSVLEIIETFQKVSGVVLNWAYGNRREGDIVQIFAETTKAETELHWKATTHLSEMLLNSWNWQKKLSNIN
ncbi:MAG: UDP-glucose 4-epimerase GalE, partial [Bacteroidota bacterium]|nr:UDP-glucose 4-epimerase GalE [Bacteroidota bacterium]